MKRVKIFDTTPGDGELSPGCSMNHWEKTELTKQLERFNIDVMEAGFAASSSIAMSPINMEYKLLMNQDAVQQILLF